MTMRFLLRTLARVLMRITVGLIALAGLGVAAAAGAAFLLYQVMIRDLPDIERIDHYRPPLASTVYARDGRPIGEFFDQRRRLVRLDEIPRHVILAFVSGEDDAFFEHSGIDIRSIVRAAYVNFTAGEIEQGASTITQQLVKSLLLTPERRYDRKIKELILARRIEQHLDKDEILELYLNQIYFGSGAWGIGEAARTYFGKSVGELSVAEGALLAGLPKAPSRFSPNVNPERAEERRRYVLGRMHELGHLDEPSWRAAVETPPVLSGLPHREDFATAAWFTEEVRRVLFDRLGGDQVLRGGLQIETTLDLDLQRTGEQALRDGLVALDRRQGWQGPLRRVRDVAAEAIALGAQNDLAVAGTPEAAHAPLAAGTPLLGVVTDVDDAAKRARVAVAPGVSGDVHLEDTTWARRRNVRQVSVPRSRISQVFSVGDVARFRVADESEAESAPTRKPAGPARAAMRLVLDQTPEVEGALFALDVGTEEVIAIVGGYDAARSQFDRAVQARRQPGSAFKPFIYAAALQHGFTAATIVNDAQVVYVDPVTGEVWKPQNYDRRFRGPLPMREALARSLNNVAVRILLDVGIPPIIDVIRRCGIRSPIDPYPSLALGTSPVTLLELTSAYAVFAAGGQRVEPIFIRRVVDRDGRLLLENVSLESPAAPGSAPAPPADGERQALDPAHAFLIADLLRAPVEHPGGTAGRARALGRPLAGKTGTTNDQGDAWFVGFSPDVAAGVWVGFDERQVLGTKETGGRAALPVWIEFMKAAHAERPVRDFPVPEGVSYARVDPATGKLAVESGGSFQAFLAGSEPQEAAADAADAEQSRRLLRMDF
ncbi:PBP1A family penicillin-binding protein [Myxococcota bacterium]|nr:PBP1A family penicillin-binding protein [Myxococcota bacterium]